MKEIALKLGKQAWYLFVVAVWVLTEAVAALFGFGLVAAYLSHWSRRDEIVAPAVIMVSAMLVPPVIYLIARGARKRRGVQGLVCAECGYSLAGLGADSPCPECGKTKTSHG